MPKISVIIPVYKVEDYLHRCVDSILGQSYQNFELILVDDGSPDNCGAICEEYARKDNRIHVIHQKNGGLSAARNAGIDWVFENSDSQWLTFVDSDDWVHKDYLKMLLEAANANNAALAMCGFTNTDSKIEDPVIEGNVFRKLAAEDAYVTCYSMCMTACCKIYRRHLFDSVRFPVGKLHEDAYVTHILTFEAKQIAVCDAPLYYYYTNPGSITRVKWTEKRLNQFEGHETRLAYLQEKGYNNAYRAELEAYTRALFVQMQDLRILSKKEHTYRKYMKMLRPKMMSAFRQVRRHGLLPFDKGNIWIYELAYPIKPVWIIRNLMEKLL